MKSAQSTGGDRVWHAQRRIPIGKANDAAAIASNDELDCMLRTFQQQSPETEPGQQHTVKTREQLLSQTGLLLPQGDKQAGFYHLSLQEFLAAQRILNLGNSADHLIAVFRERSVVAEWRKTLSFLFACLVSKFTPNTAFNS